MNIISFLESKNFALVQDKLYCGKENGLFFVFFYSTACPHCGPVQSLFNNISSRFPQNICKFGTINVSQNPKVVNLSKSSSTPIKFVPLIMAFFNNVPTAIYSEKYTEQNLIRFVKQCASNLKGQIDSFGRNKTAQAAAVAAMVVEEEIPKYAGGIPYCDDGVCYLTYEDAAYVKT